MIRSTRFWLVMGAMMVISIPEAFGQAPSDTVATARRDSLIGMETIVVTVSRARQRLAEVPSNVTVLSSQEIEGLPVGAVDEALRYVPGFSLLRDYGSDIGALPTQTVSLRGLGGLATSRALVLLDGVPINDPLIGWVPWAMIPLEEIERIEVVRGGGAGAWGNLALSGVIHLVTRDRSRSNLEASVRGGSHSTIDAKIAASGSAGRWSGRARGRVFHTDGYQRLRPVDRGPIDRRPNSRHSSATGRLAFVSEDGGRSLFLRGIAFSEERDADIELSDSSLDLGLLHAGADLGDVWGGTLHLGGFAWFQTFSRFFSSASSDRTSVTPTLDQHDVPAIRVGGTATWSRPVGENHLVTVGADALRSDVELNERLVWRADVGAFRDARTIETGSTLAGVFVTDAWEIVPDLHALVTGRVDRWESHDAAITVERRDTGEITSEDRIPSRTETSVTANAGVRYEISDRIATRSSVYRTFRAPTVNELYRPFRASGNVVTVANADLEAERLVGVEGGIDLDLSSAALVRITGFWNQVENPVFNVTVENAGPSGGRIEPCGFVPPNGVCRQRRNLGSAVTRGIEMEFQWAPGPGWRLSGSYLYDQTEITDAPEEPSVEGKWIALSPRHSLSFTGGFRSTSGLEAHASGRYVGERFDDDINSLVIDPFFVVGAEVGYRYSSGRIFVSADNLFDEVIQTNQGVDGVKRFGSPRSVRLGVSVHY